MDLVSSETAVIKEVFFEFCGITGTVLGETILSLLKCHNRDLSCCIGQWYDGATNMSSVNVGCQAIVKSKANLAFYQHCYSHSLSLAISQSCEVQEVRNMIGTTNEIYHFFNN